MSAQFEVPEPIICSPFEEPQHYWHLEEAQPPEKRATRRPSSYFYRDPASRTNEGEPGGVAVPLPLVNLIRERVKQWRTDGHPGATRTTLELLNYWKRDGRKHRLFFAQLEAAETIIFLTEARRDYLQGVTVPVDEPSDHQAAELGYKAFTRHACKMATGSGKTTVMALLAAWSILNKINDRSNARYSDVVLVVCPNVTIRSRLAEIDPRAGDSSVYRTRDLVTDAQLRDLQQGRVLVTNWHVFEPQGSQAGGVSSKVVKTGVRVRTREHITIDTKTTTARGRRYLTKEEFDRQVGAGVLSVIDREDDKDGNLAKVFIEAERYVESDTAHVKRILEEVGGKQNILVFNDEAHHAYRIRKEEPDPDEADLFGEVDEIEEFYKEATVWIDGLDRIHKLRGINVCVDLSATPYFLGRVGQDSNRPFPWVVSDLSLTDAIESGLVKIPQLAVRDSTGAAVPGYFNVWRWIQPQLTPAERGGKKGSPKPEAILKYANTPMAMLAGLWDQVRTEWELQSGDPRPPVFIVVCKNTAIAKVVYE